MWAACLSDLRWIWLYLCSVLGTAGVPSVALGVLHSGLISTNGVSLSQVRDSGNPEEGSGGRVHGPQPAYHLPCQSGLGLNIAPRNLALGGCFCNLSSVNLEPSAMSSKGEWDWLLSLLWLGWDH